MEFLIQKSAARFVVAIAVLSSTILESARGDEPLRQRFLQDYPAAATKLKNLLQDVELTVELVYDVSVDGPARRTIFARGGNAGDLVEPLTDQPRSNVFDRVHLMVDGKIYYLYQYTKGGQYAIEGTDIADESNARSFRRSYIDPYLFACVGFGPDLTPILTKPENIVDVRSLPSEQGQELLEVEFQVPGEPVHNISGGRLIFDAARDWILTEIVECRFAPRSEAGIASYGRGHREFKQLKNGAWVPAAFSLEERWKEGDEEMSRFDSDGGKLVAAKLSVDHGRFDLTSYNLGTIVENRNPGWQRRIILANAVILLALLVTGLYLRSRAKKT